MRLKLTLAYDGAGFRGWQSQPGGGSVQDILQEAMTRLAGGKRVSVQGSGRTDAGVHALGQVAHAEVPAERGAPRFWLRALNATLPPGIRVLACGRAEDSFHARYSASGKTYDYLLWAGEILPPHWAGRAWRLHPLPDPALLRRSARILRGRHDFRGFSANRGKPVEDATRHLRTVTVRQEGPVIRLRLEGDGFLYKMVRMLVAAMVRVAQGRASLEDLENRLHGRETGFQREVAPPDGLYLVRVAYRQGGANGLNSHRPAL
jgi:tRNA pseudouridine38-40 synthase